MNRIHKDSDVTQRFIFTELTLTSVANVYFLIYDPLGAVVKKMAIVEDGDFLSADVEVISDTEVEVRLNRSETVLLPLGRYTYQIRVAYNNVKFVDSIEIRSDSYTSFDIVADYEKTNEGEGVDLNFLVGSGVEEALDNGEAFVRQSKQWVDIPLADLNALLNAIRGGITGQVLSKLSDDDFDFEWING